MLNSSEYLKQYAEVKEITSSQDLKDFLQVVKTEDHISLDIETAKKENHPLAGLMPEVSRIRLIQVFCPSIEVVYLVDTWDLGIDWAHEIKDKKIYAHNSQFEDRFFTYQGIELSNLHCTLLMARVLYGLEKLSLKELSLKFLSLEMDKELQVSDWSQELSQEQKNYACLDPVATQHIAYYLEEIMKQEPHYQDTYEFLRSLIHINTKLAQNGILVDRQAHQELISEWVKQRDSVAEELKAMNWICQSHLTVKEKKLYKAEGFKLASSKKDISDYLKENLLPEELKSWKKTEKGALSTSGDQLSLLEHKYPLLGLLGKYNTLSRQIVSYGEGLEKFLVKDKLHISYRVAGNITGRYNSKEPNTQNMPRKGFKHIFISPPGYVFVGADLSQVELRVAGIVSMDPVILEAYKNGEDLHLKMALEMKSKMSEEVIKKQLEECSNDEKLFMKTLRTKAKACNFGLLFGGSAQGLIAYAKEAYQAHLTEEEANQLYHSFHSMYSHFSEYQKLITQHSRKHGEVETPFSRLTRRFKESDYWYKGKTRRDPRTIIINHPIQGGAWEILALAQIFLDKTLDSDMYQSHHVHDELVLLVPENKKIEAGRLLLQAFEYGYFTVFPGSDLNGIAEVFSGYTWSDISNGTYPLDLGIDTRKVA